MVAIIPAAGKGTRMASVTGGGAKELLRLGSKPVLLRVIEEARGCDPDQIIVVTSQDKIDMNSAVEEWSRTLFPDVPLSLAFQQARNGIAGAVAAAQTQDDAIVLAGDCVFDGPSPVSRMANLIHRGMDACVAVEPVSEQEVGLYGIAEINEMTGGITRILEKPSPIETSSRWAVAARFGLSISEMTFLLDFMDSAVPGRETTLTDVLAKGIELGHDIRAVPLQSDQRRVDCGSAEEYEAARRLGWD